MRISSINTNTRAGVKHNHARIMKSSKTNQVNNYTNNPHMKAPKLKQYSLGSAKMITRQKSEDERTKKDVVDNLEFQNKQQ